MHYQGYLPPPPFIDSLAQHGAKNAGDILLKGFIDEQNSQIKAREETLNLNKRAIKYSQINIILIVVIGAILTAFSLILAFYSQLYYFTMFGALIWITMFSYSPIRGILDKLRRQETDKK